MSSVIQVPLASEDSLHILSAFKQDKFELSILHNQKAYSGELNISDADLYTRVKYYLENGDTDNFQGLSLEKSGNEIVIVEKSNGNKNGKKEVASTILIEENYHQINSKFLEFSVSTQRILREQFDVDKAHLLHEAFVLIHGKNHRIAQLYDILNDNLSVHHCKCQTSVENAGLVNRNSKKRRIAIEPSLSPPSRALSVEKSAKTSGLNPSKLQTNDAGTSKSSNEVNDLGNEMEKETTEQGSSGSTSSVGTKSVNLKINLEEFLDDL